MVVEFPGLIPKTTNRVYFAKDLHFFPLCIESVTASGTVFCTIEAEEHIADSDHSVVMPKKLTCWYRSVPNEVRELEQMDINQLTMTINIVPETVQINGPFEDKLFTLPANNVHINDVDAQNVPAPPAKPE